VHDVFHPSLTEEVLCLAAGCLYAGPLPVSQITDYRAAGELHHYPTLFILTAADYSVKY